jgi:hypothetical protein
MINMIYYGFTGKKIAFTRPYGLTIELGLGNNENWFPQFYIGPQRFGRIRPKSRFFPGWYKDMKVHSSMYGGLKIDIGIGTMRRPIPKFWKKNFWNAPSKYIKNTETNPWNSGNHWFVLTIPIFPYIFNSGMIGNKKKKMPGYYIGGRTALVDALTHQKATFNMMDGEVDGWVLDENDKPVYAWGDESENGNIYVELTFSARTDYNH